MIRIFGILFIVLYMAYMYFIGGAFTNKEGSYSYQFIVGYMIFSFCVALGGIFIQLLNLSWWIFVMYLVAVYGVLSFVAISVMAAKHTPIIQFSKLKDFFWQQRFLLIVSIFLTILAVSQIGMIWNDNTADDGYFISLVGSLPYSPNTFYTAPRTGFQVSLKALGPYIINTIYSEYSVYSFFTGIKAPLFCRLYMSFFNYFLYGSTIVVLTENVFKQFKFNINKNLYQYTTFIMLFFAFTQTFMGKYHLIDVYDNWQYNTAMFYGSSIVRMMSLLWIVIPIFNKNRISWREVIMMAGVGFVLISKSTIALPLIVIIPISYLLSFWIFSKHSYNWLIGFLFIIAYLTISILLGNFVDFNYNISAYWGNIKESILFIPCILIIIVSCLTRNKYIVRYNAALMIVLGLMVVSPLNNIFMKLSIYNFVAARALATWYYTALVTAAVYLVLGLFYITRNDKISTIIPILVSILISLYLPFSDNLGGSTEYKPLLWRLNVLIDNPDCIPASTVALGNVLEERYHETGQMNVVTSLQITEPNGLPHYLCTMLRAVSPHSVSLSAAPIFGNSKDDMFQSFNSDSQNLLYYFIGNPTDDTYIPLENSLNDSNCNVIVTNTEVGLNGYPLSKFLYRSGFELYKVVEDPKANLQYFVYTRNV